MISLICEIKMIQMNLQSRSNSENKLMVTKGEEWEEG